MSMGTRRHLSVLITGAVLAAVCSAVPTAAQGGGGASAASAEQQADKASAAGTSGAPLERVAPGLDLAGSAGETRAERQRRFK